MSLTQDLVDAVWSIEFENLSDEDLEATRMFLLDHVGVTARGSETGSARSAQRWAKLLGTDGTSFPVIGRSGTLAAVPAALANAVAASHSIEYDDTHNAASLHPGAVVFPTAMAVATITEASTAELITAVFRGYEVMCRVGRAANPARSRRHFHPTGTVGHLGAAAASASLLGLDKLPRHLGPRDCKHHGRWRHAVPGRRVVDEAPASGFSRYERYRRGPAGRRVVRWRAGWHPGPRGFLASRGADPHPEWLLEGFGTSPLELRLTSIKAHTCCRYNQGPIDAVLNLGAEHGISPAEITGVTIGLPTAAVDIVAEPRQEKLRPRRSTPNSRCLSASGGAPDRTCRLSAVQRSDAERPRRAPSERARGLRSRSGDRSLLPTGMAGMGSNRADKWSRRSNDGD